MGDHKAKPRAVASMEWKVGLKCKYILIAKTSAVTLWLLGYSRNRKIPHRRNSGVQDLQISGIWWLPHAHPAVKSFSPQALLLQNIHKVYGALLSS